MSPNSQAADKNNLDKERIPQSGRSMIEMLGVLAIIGVLSVGGIAGYSKAMHRYRVNKTIDQITYMAGAIRTLYSTQKDYNGLSVQCTDTQRANGQCMAKKAQLVPDEMWESGEDLPQHVWGASVVVNAVCRTTRAECNQGLIRAFYIEYDYIQEEACVDLLIQDWGNANVGFIELFGNGDYGCATFPVPLNTAIEFCEGAKNEDGIHMLFYFDVDVNDWKANYGDIEEWY